MDASSNKQFIDKISQMSKGNAAPIQFGATHRPTNRKRNFTGEFNDAKNFISLRAIGDRKRLFNKNNLKA